MEHPDALPQDAQPLLAGTTVAPLKKQLLKWVGNKQKFAHEIISYFPADIRTYHEPFLGSGAVMATLAPDRAIGSDIFAPLMEIWDKLACDPEGLKAWYAERRAAFSEGDSTIQYEAIKARYNAAPNGADFLFLSRACYGGVIRFRKKDGYMSTPCGAHPPMQTRFFERRVDLWKERMQGATFKCQDFRIAMRAAQAGDLVYCDPPYADSQTILYGAQGFDLHALFREIATCKARGVRVALSMDGSKKSGAHQCDFAAPHGLFEREFQVNTGHSMLRRFQLPGQSLEHEKVADRLLLTY